MTVYLQLEVLLAALEPTGFYVKDAGLLESALARPRTTVFGQDAYESLELKAAALMHSIIKNHPMIDGNKRTSYSAMQIFLGLNGYKVIATVDSAFDFVIGVATDKYDLDQMAAWIKEHKTIRQ
jgi:death-on-curing protein